MNDCYAVAASHTLQSLIMHWARHSPDKEFCVFPESGKTISYSALEKSLRELGGRLEGTAPGDVVGIMCGNGWAATQILLGAPFHGRTALIFNLAAGDPQLAHAAKHGGCKLIFADDDNYARLCDICKQYEHEAEIIRIDRNDDIGGGDLSPPPVVASSPALLIYTSGTTGMPKGVLHSHRSLLFSGANIVTAHQLSPSDRAFCVLPLYHINGQCVTVMAPLVAGGSVVIPNKFSARDFWTRMHDNKCTWFSVVPTIVSLLLHGTDNAPSSHVRFGRSASSALPPEVHKQFEKKFAVPLVETMGLTETAAQILSNPPPPQKGKYGSPGFAVGNEVRIVDKDGATLPPDIEGEIAVRGDNLMLGYVREKSPFVNGWFMTGDLGRMDSEGYVFVTGRSKELIIKGGENIAPREIDDALYTAEGVAEAAAFGVSCDKYGQQPEAAVVLVKGADCDEEALINICRKAVGEFKSPRRIHFMDSLPKGPSGKIQRLKLAEILAD